MKLVVHRHHFYIGLVALVIFGSGTFYVLRTGLYPVAMVNGEFIWASHFERTAISAFNFYANALDTYQRQQLTQEESDQLFGEIRRASLERLIDEAVVADKATADFGAVLDDAVDKKLRAVDNAKLDGAVRELYGLSAEEFAQAVLAPTALADVIRERLNVEQKDYASWLNAAKRDANVRIFLPGFSYMNGGVEAE